ncbi:MAG TPA: adenylate/guanylate cyclase domain-containing protein, partial [Planctomycetota bacterium]|nr:adenylate/guanylate cyclase domain-containing protein [Planctomycetota bacterium]
MAAETSKLKSSLLAGAGVAAVVALLAHSPVVERLELRTRDLRNEWTMRPAVDGDPFGHPAVALLMVTQESIDWLQQESKRPWPWPREVFGYLFRACAIGGAEAILFDFFTHIDPDPLGTEKEWVAEMKKAPPAWFAVPFSERARPTADAREDLSALLDRWAIRVDNDGSVELEEPYASVNLPVPEVAPAIAGVCDVHTPRDVDGLIRRCRMLTRFRGRHYPSFALAALMAREKVREARIRAGRLEVGRVSFPVERDGSVRIRYAQPFGFMAASPVISGVWDLEEKGGTTQFDPARLKGRVVILGTDAPALFDIRPTPGREMAGAEIHATVIRNILAGELLRPVPAGVGLLVVAVLAVGTALAVRHASALAGAAVALGAAAGYAGLSVALFSAGRIVDLVAPLAAVGLSYGAASSLNFLFEGRQRLRIKRQFQHYMSPQVVEKILRNPDALSLAGERKLLTIFFMDFAGFTAMSEKLEPTELVKLINEYHHEAAEEIFRTDGTLDKYIGDA